MQPQNSVSTIGFNNTRVIWTVHRSKNSTHSQYMWQLCLRVQPPFSIVVWILAMVPPKTIAIITFICWYRNLSFFYSSCDVNTSSYFENHRFHQEVFEPGFLFNYTPQQYCWNVDDLLNTFKHLFYFTMLETELKSQSKSSEIILLVSNFFFKPISGLSTCCFCISLVQKI